MDTVLSADVGGTHTRLALYRWGDMRAPLFLRVYGSAQFPGLMDVVTRFLDEARSSVPQARLVAAGFGVAGPADGATVKLTNLPWVVRRDEISRSLRLDRVVFVNDFAAVCRAVPSLAPEHLHAIGAGAIEEGRPKVVLGAGTGLGIGFLFQNGPSYLVVPSEGGHTEFAPRDTRQARLMEHLRARHGQVCNEHVLSGPGLVSLYGFLRDVEGIGEALPVQLAMRKEDPAAVIAHMGTSRADLLCSQTLDLFCEIYGAVAANLALLVLARGGVYMAGGIAGHILSRLEAGGFRKAFELHPRYGELLRSIPTLLITHPQPGLLGAALAAEEP
jgi:glucokinase